MRRGGPGPRRLRRRRGFRGAGWLRGRFRPGTLPYAAAPLGIGMALAVLAARALLKYIRSKDARQERVQVKRSLGEALRARRTACKMTQEFVAEALGVSRQAVSKWEQGAADPSTSNLLGLAKLYGVSAEELLKEVQ